MKETIDSVIKMNEKAKLIIEEAERKAEKIISDANLQANSISAEIIENAKQKAAENERKTAAKYSARIEQNAENIKIQNDEFLSKFENGKQKWIDEIYGEIISGDSNA